MYYVQDLQHMCYLLWEGHNIKNDFFDRQLDLEGLVKVLSVHPHIHMVQCDHVNDAGNVTPVYLAA